MEFDRNGLEVLDRSESLAALVSVPVGRVGLSVDALPVILPVNFVVDGDDIIIRTADGARTDAALGGSVVAFEVDAHDRTGQMGWSVLVRGRSRFVDDPSEIARLSEAWVPSWQAPETSRWVAISMDIVTGRRVALRPTTAVGPWVPGERVPAGTDGAARATATVLAWNAWGSVRADHHTMATIGALLPASRVASIADEERSGDQRTWSSDRCSQPPPARRSLPTRTDPRSQP